MLEDSARALLEAASGELSALKALLAAGANPKATNESARTPLSVAFEYHSAAVVEWMEAEGLEN